ncbi:MAG: DUF5667 domain-containing protein [Candidatus Shapirobacteria bacterium]|jgi:hypothetical protein
MKFWLKIIIIVLALGILYISFIRASLEKVNDDEKYDKLRKIPISLQLENREGILEKDCYKLPETRTLPDSPFYILKKLRDELWIKFSNNQLNKVKIMLLIADKKMEEAIMLNQKNSNKNLVMKTSQEAVEKLKSVEELVLNMETGDIEVQKIDQRIKTANLAYKKIIDSFELNDKNQQKLFQLIDTCNE